jgi:inner membrane protein
MDNFTHSLIGAAIAQGAIQYRLARQRYKQHQKSASASSDPPETPDPPETRFAKESEKTHKPKQTQNLTPQAAGIAALPMMVTSIIANNFPDLDLMVTAFMDPQLGYILHHRGHTHTLAFTLLQPLLILGFLRLYQRWKGTSWSKEDWHWFFGLAFFGGMMHLGMDSWNVYGVHPFWPLNNHWYYGDFVFIIEPLFWMTLIPWLYSKMQNRWSRNLLFFFYTIGLSALFFVYFTTPWYPLLVLVLGLSYGLFIHKQTNSARQAWLSLAATMLVFCALLGSSIWLKNMLRKALHQQDPHEKIADIALISYPSNPFCYQWISVGYHKKSRDYIMRKGIFSFFPQLLQCPQFGSETTAHLTPSSESLRTQFGGLVGSQKVFRRPLQELRALKGHCQLDAAMQFIRTPSWKLSPHSHSFYIGDLRFDRRKAHDLAEFEFPLTPQTCPPLRPPWVAPLTKGGLW